MRRREEGGKKREKRRDRGIFTISRGRERPVFEKQRPAGQLAIGQAKVKRLLLFYNRKGQERRGRVVVEVGAGSFLPLLDSYHHRSTLP